MATSRSIPTRIRVAVRGVSAGLLALSLSLAAGAGEKSPRGEAATRVGADFDQWIRIDYGRPILDGRIGVFGAGDTYGARVNAGAPVWRAGADRTTRFKTDVTLLFGAVALPAGEYSLFVDLQTPQTWVFVFSKHEPQEQYDPEETEKIWGSYGYDSTQDVVRATATVTENVLSVDQLTFFFANITPTSGDLGLQWEKSVATVPFTVSPAG